MTHADRDQASFTFSLQGASDADVIGNWAQEVALPPDFFAELLKSLRCEWMDAGCGPSTATAAEEVALAAYNRNGARDNTDDAHNMAHSILQVAVRAIDCEIGLKV